MRTVGFDFGTHQTKVCVENREGAELQYEFFKFKDAKGVEQYTLPSVLGVDKKGLVRYGYLSDEVSNTSGLLQSIKSLVSKQSGFDGKIVRYFKQATFTSTSNNMSKVDAVYYSIWYISYILFDLEAKYGQDFAIQMGVPTDGERLNSQKQLVVRILLSAYRLVEEVFKNDKDAFLRTPIQQLREKTVFIPYSEEKKEEYNILVFPEAYACLMPLIKQNKIASGMSLMIDIGGGTTDISFFTINVENTPQVYGLFSIDKGLNYLTDAMNSNRKRTSSNVESASEILKDRRCSYEKEIESVCLKLNNSLAQEFRKQSRLPMSRLTDALKARPVIYTGGGSTFDIMRKPYLGFKDIIHISKKEWRSECVVDMNRISALGLCPILSTSYGLSISMTHDNIKCEPFRDIFKLFREIQDEGQGNRYQYGRAFGGFSYTDDWDAVK